MKNLKNFIFYNNTVPLVFGVLFLGTTLTFAANEEAREAIIDSEERLTSVDNTFIRNVNLATFDAEVYVDRIEEDDDNYYVYYVVNTIDVADGQWQPVSREDVLTVGKDSLGDNDLGLYVSKELSDLYNFEMNRLAETQEIEKSMGQTNKVITTMYDGIVGRMFDPAQRVFPGYDPVIVPPQDTSRPARVFEEELEDGEVVVIENQGNSGGSSDPEPVPTPDPAATSTPPTATTTPPTDPEPVASTTPPTEPDPVPEPVATSTAPTATTTPPVDTGTEPETTPEPVEAADETQDTETAVEDSPSTGETVSDL